MKEGFDEELKKNENEKLLSNEVKSVHTLESNPEKLPPFQEWILLKEIEQKLRKDLVRNAKRELKNQRAEQIEMEKITNQRKRESLIEWEK